MEKARQIGPARSSQETKVSDSYNKWLVSIAEKALPIVRKYGVQFSTREDSSLSGRDFNDGLHYFNPEQGFGIELIYLSNDCENGKKALVIKAASLAADQIKMIIDGDGAILDVPIMAKGRLMQGLTRINEASLEANKLHKHEELLRTSSHGSDTY